MTISYRMAISLYFFLCAGMPSAARERTLAVCGMRHIPLPSAYGRTLFQHLYLCADKRLPCGTKLDPNARRPCDRRTQSLPPHMRHRGIPAHARADESVLHPHTTHGLQFHPWKYAAGNASAFSKNVFFHLQRPVCAVLPHYGSSGVLNSLVTALHATGCCTLA